MEIYTFIVYALSLHDADRAADLLNISADIPVTVIVLPLHRMPIRRPIASTIAMHCAANVPQLWSADVHRRMIVTTRHRAL